MKVTIENETTKNPLEVIGKYAGECWGSDISNRDNNIKRGKNCLADGHGRTLEFPQIYLKFEGVSARLMREWYTHLGGMPTRLQASTRYINYQKGFNYIIPKSIQKDSDAKKVYEDTMDEILKGLQKLESLEIKHEDSANLLPLGMETVVVTRTNLRMLIDMSRQRMCKRAYWEYRDLMDLIIKELNEYSKEYEYITNNYFGPKCNFLGYCPESHSCTVCLRV